MAGMPLPQPSSRRGIGESSGEAGDEVVFRRAKRRSRNSRRKVSVALLKVVK